MMKMKRIIYIVLLLTIVSACGGGGDSGGGGGGGDAPDIRKEYLSVPPNLELLAEGQTSELNISANCSWTITVDVTWLTVTPTSGTNSQKVSVTASKNETGESRVAIITVKGGSLPEKKVTITQSKIEEIIRLSVSTNGLNYENTGGTSKFTISSNTNWYITCPDWCTVSIPEGKGDATISVTANDNPTTSERNGQIIIKGDGVSDVIIDIKQKAGEEESHQPGSDDNVPPN